MTKKETAIQFYAECLNRRREDPELNRQLKAIETIGRKFYDRYGVDQLDRYAGPLRWLHDFEKAGRQGGWPRFCKILGRTFRQSLQVVTPCTARRVRSLTDDKLPSFQGNGLRLPKAQASAYVKAWNQTAKLAGSNVRFRVTACKQSQKRKDDLRTIVCYEISFAEKDPRMIYLDALEDPSFLLGVDDEPGEEVPDGW